MMPARYRMLLLLAALVALVLVIALQPRADRAPAPAEVAAPAGPEAPGAEGIGMPGAPAVPRDAHGPVQPLSAPVISLHGTWSLWFPKAEPSQAKPFSQAHARRIVELPREDRSAISARVPGTVQEALTEAGVLPSPHTSRGRDVHLWVSGKEWWLYHGQIVPDDWRGRSVRLELGDVRGEVDAWLNGIALRRAEGACDVVFDVPPDVLKWRGDGDKAAPANWLALRLKPRESEPASRGLAPLGILGIARLRSFRQCLVDRVSVQVGHFAPDQAVLRVNSLLRNSGREDKRVDLAIHVSPQASEGPEAVARAAATVPAQGAVSVTATCQIDQPQLWWPHGLGPRAFYRVRVVASAQGVETSSAEVTTAIREVAASRSPTKDDPYECRLLVNQTRPIEVLGSVWTSADWVIPADHEQLVDLAASAGINAFYATGRPEVDRFYRLCDQQGIMVFQYISVPLPDDPAGSSLDTLEGPRAEIMRLMNHPCIVMWCLGGPSPGPVVDERVKDAIRRLERDLDPSRPFVAVRDDTSSLALWSASYRPEQAATLWRQTHILRANGCQALCGRPLLSSLLSQGDTRPAGPTSPLADSVLAHVEHYGSSTTLTAQISSSWLEQTLTFERQIAPLMAASLERSGMIVGRFNQPRPDVVAGLAQWDGRPMPALHWLKRHWQGLSIFADMPSQQGDALIVRRGESLSANIYVANRSTVARRSLIAAAKLTDLHNELVAKTAERVDLPAGSIQWVTRFEPLVPSDCKHEVLLLSLSLSDPSGQMLASATLWFGVSPNFEDKKVLDVMVLADDVAQATERWSFLDRHGIAVTIAQAPPPPEPAREPVLPTNDLNEQPQGWVEPAPTNGAQGVDGTGGADGVQAAPKEQEGREGDGPASRTTPANKDAKSGPAVTVPEQVDGGAKEVAAQAPPSTGATSAPIPHADVVIFDAKACAEDRLAQLAASVQAGTGLLIVQTPADTTGSSLDALMPIEVLSEERFDYGDHPAVRLAGHPMVSDIDIVALAAKGTYYRYKLKPEAAVVADRGNGRPLVVESRWGTGRVALFTPNLAAPPDADTENYRRLIANTMGYLANLPFPQMVRLRRPASRGAYRGLRKIQDASVDVATSIALPVSGPAASAQPSPSAEPGSGVLPPRASAVRAEVRATVVNTSAVTALSCALSVVGLPDSITMEASDNHFHLAPGEARQVALRFESTLPPGDSEYPVVLRVEGFNVPQREVTFAVRFDPSSALPKPAVQKVSKNKDSVAQWDMIELAARIRATYANPFRDVTVTAELTSPTREKVVARGFYDGGQTWRVRFAPSQTGEWEYRLVVRDETGEGEARGSFDCVAPQRVGFVRVSKHDPAKLTLADGSPFVAIGGGCFSPWEPWATGGGSFKDYLTLHHEHRMNAMRIFLYQEFHRGLGREAMVNLLAEGTADRFDLTLCRRLDEFMAFAREQDVYPIVTLFDHWSVKNGWDRYAYAAGNAGPCLTQAELFTDPHALAHHKFFVDYVIARWSAFSNVLAWEFWNEADLVDPGVLDKGSAALQWHRNMASHVRSVDPHRHLTFTSFSSGITPGDWYREAWNQLISYHHYLAYLGGTESSIGDDLYQTSGQFNGIRKPFLLAELGYEKLRGDERPQKRHYLRAGAWTAVFMGGGVILWDDLDFRITSDTRGDLQRLATFVAGNDLGTLQPLAAPLKALGRNDLNAWLLSSPAGDRCALYVHNSESHAAEVADAYVPVPIRGSGSYSITWVDPETGARVAEGQRGCQGGLVVLRVPSFNGDIAGVMAR